MGAGLLIGCAQLMWDATEIVGGPGYISQRTFEDELHRTPGPDEPHLTGLSFKPGGMLDIVELTYRMPPSMGIGDWRTVKFAAPRPYLPLDSAAAGHPSPSVYQYLSDVQSTRSLPPTQFGWWHAPAAALGLYALGGLVLIGAGSAVRRFLRNGAGKNVRSTEIPSLPKIAAGSDLPQSHTEDTPAERGDTVPAAAPAEAAVQELSNTPLPPPIPAPTSTDKEYAGEFYPVEKQAPHGFSLIELVVLIGIIAILIAFLLPAMRLAQAQARTAQCASQLRQIGFALHAYANANHGWLPAWSGWHTWPPGQSEDEPGPAWMIELMPYIGSPDSPVYNCPSWPGPNRCRNYFLETQWSGRSGRRAMKLSDITLSSQFILSGDKTNLALSPPPFGTGSYQDDVDPDDFGQVGALLWPWTGGFYMHFHGNNVLFDDVHVELCIQFDPKIMTFNPHRVENWADVTPN